MTVDTLSMAKKLRAAELSPMQAEAIGRLIEGAATKADIQLFKSDLQQVASRLEAKIEQLRSNLMTWFIGPNLTLAAIIVAVVKL